MLQQIRDKVRDFLVRAKKNGEELDRPYQVKHECLCHFPGCTEFFLWAYLHGGTAYSVQPAGRELPFFSRKMLEKVKESLQNFRWLRENNENAYTESHTILKVCGTHHPEKCIWTTVRLRRLGWPGDAP